MIFKVNSRTLALGYIPFGQSQYLGPSHSFILQENQQNMCLGHYNVAYNGDMCFLQRVLMYPDKTLQMLPLHPI